MKFQGVVIERSGDAFTIRDRTRTDYQVLITDNTSVKTYGGFLRSGKKYPVTDILRGLIVEVEGKTVEEEADIEAVFLRRSARFAAVGFAFLAFGFVGILAYRIMEIYYVQ